MATFKIVIYTTERQNKWVINTAFEDGLKFKLKKIDTTANNNLMANEKCNKWKTILFVNDETRTHFVVMIPSKPSEYTFIIFYSPFSSRRFVLSSERWRKKSECGTRTFCTAIFSGVEQNFPKLYPDFREHYL